MDAREYLTQFIGLEIIRTKPARISVDSPFQNSVSEPVYDWTYTEIPIVLSGFKDKGEIKFRYVCKKGSFSQKEFTMPAYFTDNNWTTLTEAMKVDNDNPFNDWGGKKIKRIRPTVRGLETFMEKSQNEVSPKLLYVAQNHILLQPFNGRKTMIFGSDFLIQDDWILAEE